MAQKRGLREEKRIRSAADHGGPRKPLQFVWPKIRARVLEFAPETGARVQLLDTRIGNFEIKREPKPTVLVIHLDLPVVVACSKQHPALEGREIGNDSLNAAFNEAADIMELVCPLMEEKHETDSEGKITLPPNFIAGIELDGTNTNVTTVTNNGYCVIMATKFFQDHETAMIEACKLSLPEFFAVLKENLTPPAPKSRRGKLHPIVTLGTPTVQNG